MRSIAAGAFKARCLKLMDEVEKTREPLLITKNGRPVAQLVPPAPAATDDFFGGLRGWLKIVGDIEAPIDPPEVWRERDSKL